MPTAECPSGSKEGMREFVQSRGTFPAGSLDVPGMSFRAFRAKPKPVRRLLGRFRRSIVKRWRRWQGLPPLAPMPPGPAFAPGTTGEIPAEAAPVILARIKRRREAFLGRSGHRRLP